MSEPYQWEWLKIAFPVQEIKTKQNTGADGGAA